MQFLLLPLGTGGQKLSARCQPRSQTYQLVTGMKGFIPPDTHLAGSQQDEFLHAFELRPVMSGARLQQIDVKD